MKDNIPIKLSREENYAAIKKLSRAFSFVKGTYGQFTNYDAMSFS